MIKLFNLKFILILGILLIPIINIANFVWAYEDLTPDPSTIFGDPIKIPYYESSGPDQNKDTAPSIISDTAKGIINMIFSIAGFLGAMSVVVAGTLYVLGHANEEYHNTAKKILIYTLIGFAIMVSAYAIIFGISNLDIS
ncbi:hypothetical protein A2483_04240 [Candidatus Peregrinibacteria bacterium RIFOXYC2_FULL_33_13]|nr:MAG: hypothetical protein UR30_C0016G0006 [Candidatus Peregrinibacteria bacterium GW2011_GWC2_33_13]OGJ49295.1 MAG: hypothetical protein A2229_01700 [Candidatus Peregrinibacteria bacterium RIFOXYA2_FULL_33_7]OGJ52720.1 MAG: hypothetical protein A2483_04240 [Candidatus Peregrinibacteria bacterium RIFOXYC2_FULL_33_13]